MTVTRRPHQQRLRTDVDALIDAAAAVFARSGFHATTMVDVAVQAATSKPTLYAHVGSKDALFAAVLEREAATCRDWLFARYEAAAPLPMLEEVACDMHALFDYVAAHADGFQLLFGPESVPAAAEVRAALLADITEQVARRFHDNTSPGVGRPGRTERQLAAAVVGVAFSGAGFAARTGTSLAKARDTATEFAVAAIAGMSGAAR
jgi:AcrR family transcriptional regulator